MEIRIPQYKIFSKEEDLLKFLETNQENYLFVKVTDYQFDGRQIGNYVPRITRYIAEYYRKDADTTV